MSPPSHSADKGEEGKGELCDHGGGSARGMGTGAAETAALTCAAADATANATAAEADGISWWCERS